MLQMKTILLATDLSESSKIAFSLACSLGRDHGAKLIVLHAVPTGTHEALLMAQLGQGDSAAEFRDEIQHELHDFHPAPADVSIEYQMVKGSPTSAIVQKAKETGCDLIVMGTHGRTGLKRVLMGSVAEHVMRSAPCPVLVVKAHASEGNDSAA